MGTGPLPGVERGRGVTRIRYPLLVPRSKKQSKAVPLLSERAFVACKKGETIHTAKHKKRFGMEIPQKTETMTFFPQDPIRCKSVVDSKCLQHVKNFRYLGCEMSYEYDNIIKKNYQNLLNYWES
jgi:hypothetical protein